MDIFSFSQKLARAVAAADQVSFMNPFSKLAFEQARADPEKEKAPVWGLRGFRPGLEVGRGFWRLRCSGLGFEGGPEWGWAAYKQTI